MALLKFKSTVVVPKVCIIAAGVINAANQIGITVDIVVTSGNDSKHKLGSLHYRDRALDFRTKTLTPDEKHLLVEAVRSRLGSDYDVILESEGQSQEHLHCEFDPVPRPVVDS